MKSKQLFCAFFLPLMALSLILNAVNFHLDNDHKRFSIVIHCLHIAVVIAMVIIVVMMFRASKNEKKEKD